MYDKIFYKFERILGIALLVVISIVAVASVIELAYTLVRDIFTGPGLLFEIRELFNIFGMFMLVLIAIELMSSIHAHLDNKSNHVEVMLIIAITAVTRKIVILDSKNVDAAYIASLALLFLSLSVGYYLLKRGRVKKEPEA